MYGEDISDEQLQQRLLSLHDEAHQNREEIKELERELESIKKKEKVVQFKMQVIINGQWTINKITLFVDLNYWLKFLYTFRLGPTNDNSIKVPKVFDPMNMTV